MRYACTQTGLVLTDPQSIRQRQQVGARRVADPRAGGVRDLAGSPVGLAAGGPKSVAGAHLVAEQQEAAGKGQGV